jgi:hypothetical protein
MLEIRRTKTKKPESMPNIIMTSLSLFIKKIEFALCVVECA